MMTIQGTPVKVCFYLVSEKTLRISILPAGESVREVFSAIDLAERDWPEPALSLMEDGRVRAGEFTAELAGSTLRIAWRGTPLQTLCVSPEGAGISFPLGDRPVYGLGHGYGKHPDRRGEKYDLRVNGQVPDIVRYGSATSPSPYVISPAGWALFFHQPWKANIDLTGSEGVFSPQTLWPAEYADIFAVACPRPEDAAREYYALTGIPPLPPRYAFGYQQCYRTLSYRGENQVMKTARYMREHDLPCDLLIYLGTGYCDNGWNTRNGNFDFNPVSFPELEKTMAQLHEMSYKVSLHVTNCFTGLHGRVGDEPVSPLEYDHAKNYWKVHEALYATAKNEAWWPDDGDEVDMEQRLTRHRMYYEGSLKLNPDTRPLQMQRNAFPGCTKWGGIIWSGDVHASWRTLRNQIPIGLNCGLSCTPFWGTDTGGFFSTEEFTGELFIRWFEYSAFTPFFRGHGRPSYLHNPWGWTVNRSWDTVPPESSLGLKGSAQPPENALPDDRVEPVCRKYLHERYALLPYIYNAACQVREKGLPMMRPLYLAFPEDPGAEKVWDEYMLGDSLLVAPVTEQGADSRQVYLPAGRWADCRTGEALEGGRTITAPAPLEVIPLFVRAGGILPRGPVTPFVPARKPEAFDPLSVTVYPGADGEYELYEDDGISLGYTRNECSRTRFVWNNAARTLTASGASFLFPGTERTVPYTVAGTGESGSVTLTYGNFEA